MREHPKNASQDAFRIVGNRAFAEVYRSDMAELSIVQTIDVERIAGDEYCYLLEHHALPYDVKETLQCHQNEGPSWPSMTQIIAKLQRSQTRKGIPDSLKPLVICTLQ